MINYYLFITFLSFKDHTLKGGIRCRTLYVSSTCFLYHTGFVEKEIKKANIPIVDTGENPEVPFPRDMIDLEVTALSVLTINLVICC